MSDAVKWVYRFDEVREAEAVVGGDWDQVRGCLAARAQTSGT